jgi:hypothetical protein
MRERRHSQFAAGIGVLSEQDRTSRWHESLSPKLCTTEAMPLTPVPSPPMGGEGRVNCNLLLPLRWGEAGRRPGEGVAADGASAFSVDGIVRCII